MLLSDILELNVRRHPGAPAVIAGERTVTFAQLQERSRRLANALLNLARPGDRVAILAENVPEYLDAYYGVPSAGMALAFLNYRLHPKELAWIMNDAGARVLLCQSSYLGAVAEIRGDLTSVEHVVALGEAADGPAYDDLVGAAPASPPAAGVADDDLAWLIYTSGTTGRPKGAMLTHRNLLAAIANSLMSFDFRADDRSLLSFPLCHIAGYSVTTGHVRGIPVVLMPTFEAELFSELVERHRITSTALAPTMVNLLLQHPATDRHDLSSLRRIGYGAAAMPAEVCRAALERFGPVLYSAFGMTELAGNVLVHPVEAHVRAARGEEHLLAGCGVPMPLAAVRVVDDDLRELPPGEVGEIAVWGDQVLAGYWGNEEASAEAFAGGWFHTGDMARRDEEGFFYLVDRKKDMILTGGENVYSREVEEAIYAHPGVSEVAVIGLPDPMWGENVCAVVVPRRGQQVSAEDVIAACRDRLAGYKKPKQVVFVEELPKNVSGKILKRELRDRLGAGDAARG